MKRVIAKEGLVLLFFGFLIICADVFGEYNKEQAYRASQLICSSEALECPQHARPGDIIAYMEYKHEGLSSYAAEYSMGRILGDKGSKLFYQMSDNLNIERAMDTFKTKVVWYLYLCYLIFSFIFWALSVLRKGER